MEKRELDYEVPLRAGEVLDDSLTVPMEGKLKEEIQALQELKVKPLEWVRRVLRKELPKLKQALHKKAHTG